MADNEESDLVRAAGGVVWRPAQAGAEIALVHRPRYDDWSFPKGKCERGEHELATAIREIKEETGLRVVLGRRLASSVYRVAAGVKRVSYWAARCVGSAGFVPGHEVDQVRWLPAAEVKALLTYERDQVLLEEFRSGPVLTDPLVLLRHAAAGRKQDWVSGRAQQPDLDRPLDPSGSADADVLASLLASYGQCQVISSAAERCVATVRPYAAAVGVPVQVRSELTVTPEPARDASLLTLATGTARAPTRGQPAWPAQRAAGIAVQLAVSGRPTLICAHRENLPAMIEAVFDALGASRPDAEPLGKSEFWVLQSADGALVSAERHDPSRLGAVVSGRWLPTERSNQHRRIRSRCRPRPGWLPARVTVESVGGPR
jgi:8-oxo-dGTP diphosphatase